ncbi:MAG: hypothetical protein JXQ65_08005 [Candidatus Marinimicrobia bacterium]|nr:hypothetical protein [Candidatus Neomarinimicrobiota bacterium]
MPINFKVIPEKKLISIKWVGRITGSMVLESFKNFHHANGWSPYYNELVDLSEAELTDITKFTIMEFKQFIETVLSQNDHKKKVAIYAPNSLQFGISRSFSTQIEDLQYIQVFKKLEEAKQWLGID